MNTPIVRTNQTLKGKPVYLLNGEQVQLHLGPNETRVYWGMDEKGQPRFAPTRRQRRAHLQKQNRKTLFGRQTRSQTVVLKDGTLKFLRHMVGKILN